MAGVDSLEQTSDLRVLVSAAAALHLHANKGERLDTHWVDCCPNTIKCLRKIGHLDGQQLLQNEISFLLHFLEEAKAVVDDGVKMLLLWRRILKPKSVERVERRHHASPPGDGGTEGGRPIRFLLDIDLQNKVNLVSPCNLYLRPLTV